jgi:hypothetical protein
MAQTVARRRVESFSEVVVVLVCTVAFAAFVLAICMLVLSGNHPGARDFISFWAAGHQLLHHQNPYDPAAVLAIEQGFEFPGWAQVLIMRNPPWALCLVLPLGLTGLKAGTLLWTCFQVGALALAGHLLWVMEGRCKDKLHLLMYAFAPALGCVLSGQTGLFALLGLVLFLRLQLRQMFLAGLALWFCALKPHLFLPFGVVLAIWTVRTRSYKLFAGLLVAVGASSLVATYLDPGVWRQYQAMMTSSGISGEYIACFAVAFRFAIHRDWVWLQYVPAAVGSIWAIGYYWRRRESWDWRTDGALLMLVSLLVSPYAWVSDQSLAMPAILIGVYRANARWPLFGLALASAVLELQELAGVSLHSPWVLWTSPFWLGWYLVVQAKASRPLMPITAQDLGYSVS